ncbi:MAG: DUF2089 domain-containing protein [Chloroflexi bacterium]|nr:DUF2089 domain-containing protein [Chloroflexota bacterium]
MNVTRLHCRHCDTTLEGQFALGRFYQLSPEQLAFVETFVRCEGKITRVQEELGLSYPAVRARLNDAIRGLGYEVKEEEPTLPLAERQAVLDDLAKGKISPDEALKLLRTGE